MIKIIMKIIIKIIMKIIIITIITITALQHLEAVVDVSCLPLGVSSALVHLRAIITMILTITKLIIILGIILHNINKIMNQNYYYYYYC